MSEVTFKVSSALKTILGKELVTDDFIAVFELVKNSFDAQARRVDIVFRDLGTDNARIVVADDGDGMTRADIEGKWLFVAYSAKKGGTNYRDKISERRTFAGAKGIGRFSCDRLGASLTLHTRARGETGQWSRLSVGWDDFEVDAEREFQRIPAEYTRVRSAPEAIATHGTVVEIADLRSTDWDRDKLLRLRRSLERLVNPNQENDAHNFRINLFAPNEQAQDRQVKKGARKGEPVEQWNLVNGPIRNFLFEHLGLKTARVEAAIPEDGSTIITRLFDRGAFVYEVAEKNPFAQTLHDVKVHLFALNQSAKHTFTRRMGITARDYGSVFLYKNGFRVHPFGDPGDDNLGIDRRHQQGFLRYLGTRDLSGRVEIAGPNPGFQETSSRDGGLIRNQEFRDLKEFFVEFALRRLERYVIDLAQFGEERGELPDPSRLSQPEAQQAIVDIIGRLAQSKHVLSVNYDPEFLNIVKIQSAESLTTLLKGFKRLAASSNTSTLTSEVRKAERQLERLAKAKAEAEAAEARERERAIRAELAARSAQAKALAAEERAVRAHQAEQAARMREEQLDTQNIFLKSILSRDLEHVLALHHSIGQDALTIELYVGNLLAMIAEDSSPRPEQMRVPLERISFVSKRIGTVAKFATQANHRAAKEELVTDLVEYMREYVLNVYQGVVLGKQNKPIKLLFHQKKSEAFKTKFSPIEVSMVLDNLISNSRKHKVTQIDVSVLSCTKDELLVSFRDNGTGIPKKNLDRVFEIGFSTTDGSGLGLHHVRQLMTEMGGAISVNGECRDGADFHLRFVHHED